MRFRDLKKKLKEAFLTVPTVTSGYKVGPMDGTNSADYNANLGDLDTKNIDKINTFVSAICARSYMDPDAALAQLQQKLMTIGLTFTYRQGQGSFEGDMSFPLSYLGGSYGTDVHTFDPDYDDGISRKYGYGLSLIVSSRKMEDGLSRLMAKVVKTPPQKSSNPSVPMGVNTPLER